MPLLYQQLIHPLSLFSITPGSHSGPVATCTPSPLLWIVMFWMNQLLSLPSFFNLHETSMSSGPTSFTELTYQLPLGLKDYGHQSFFNLLPNTGYAFSGDLVNLESESPSAGGDWQRIASTGSLLGPNWGCNSRTQWHIRTFLP